VKLVGSLASPFVRKVRVALAEKALACEFVLGDVMPLDSPVYAWHPLGKIPCLLLDDGSVLHDSSVICEYLDLMGSGPQLLPTDGRRRVDVRCWESLADGILDAAVLYRWEATQRELRYRDPAWLQRQRARVFNGLSAVSRQLGDRLHCFGDDYSLADIAVGCMLDWLAFRLREFDWRRDHPNLHDLANRLHQRPSFAETMPQ
jgi:glutathione S-transferase